MHPEFGLVKLSEEIDWVSLIEEPGKIEETIRKPLNGVFIPQKIESYTVEMDDDKVMQTLESRQTEEEWMNNLPFDLKKVMAGNKKEIEKYLAYIEKYPERAIELGVPLDIMGTSREMALQNSLGWKDCLERILVRAGECRNKNFRRLFWAVIVIAIIARIVWPSEKENLLRKQALLQERSCQCCKNTCRYDCLPVRNL
jgi:hypothetical protein